MRTQVKSTLPRVRNKCLSDLYILKLYTNRGAWMVQLVKLLDFSSGHNFKVLESSSALGSVLGVEPTKEEKKKKKDK